MKFQIYRALFSFIVLFFIFSCAGSRVAGPQADKSSRCIWVCGQPTTFFIDEDEKQSASFIPLDQLEQFKKAGSLHRSLLDNRLYFIDDKPNDIYLTSYLAKVGGTYYLFSYAIDLISGRLVYGGYHVSKKIDSFKMVSYWPIDQIEKYDIEDHEDMNLPEGKNVLLAVGDIKAGMADDAFILMNMSVCGLSDNKDINVKTWIWLKDIIKVQDLIKAASEEGEVIELPSPDKYFGRMMRANLIYTIHVGMNLTGGDKVGLHERVEVESENGLTVSIDEADIPINILKRGDLHNHLEAVASNISKTIYERAASYKPMVAVEEVITDNSTGEILGVIHKNSLKVE